MINLAANISLYSSTSINDAMQLPASMATKIFESKAFDGWKQGRESELKIQGAIISRLNDVIRAVIVVAKTIAKRGR